MDGLDGLNGCIDILDEWVVGCNDESDGWTIAWDGWMHRWNGWVDEWTNVWVDVWDGRSAELEGLIDWLDEWMIGRTHRLDGWIVMRVGNED